MKALGNAAFARGDYTSATQLFKGAITAREPDPAALYRCAPCTPCIHTLRRGCVWFHANSTGFECAAGSLGPQRERLAPDMPGLCVGLQQPVPLATAHR